MKFGTRTKYPVLIKFLFFASALISASIHSAPAYAVQEGPEQGDTQKQKSDLKTQTLNVSLELGDGRTLKGKIKFNAPEKLVIRHTKNEISYSKEVSVLDFAEIEIAKWKPSHLRKSKDGEVYRFNVSSFTLKISNGNSFFINENFFSFFEQLIIENSNGQVSLYSYWIDLLRPDGSWYTGMNGPATGSRVTCHKDVIKKIIFSDFH